MPKPWFTVTAAASSNKGDTATAAPKTAEIALRGFIGEQSEYTDWWTGEKVEGGAGTLKEFAAAVKALGDVEEITLLITSHGGDAGVGLAIHNILAAHPARIVARIEGYAMSAASLIPMAADEIEMAPSAIMMIHGASDWSLEPRNIAAHQRAIEMLSSYNEAYAEAYAAKTGKSKEEWLTLMQEDYYLTGREAHELKLVDTLTEDVALSAIAGLGRPRAAVGTSLPERIVAQIDKALQTQATHTTAPTPETIPDMTAEEIAQLVGDKITAEMQPLKDQLAAAETKLATAESTITAQAAELARQKDLMEKGIPTASAAATEAVSAQGNSQGSEGVTMKKSEYNKLSARAKADFHKDRRNQIIDG